MDERKKLILQAIIEEYIRTGSPVGSGVLVDKYGLGYSSATVRNEMARLESEDLIVQPHISAGRVPTEKAFALYLEGLKCQRMPRKIVEELDKTLSGLDDITLKETAKKLSELSGLAVFWAFHKNNYYYTGISNLFKQPEFSQLEIIYDISSIIDRADEIISAIFEQTKLGTKVIFGRKNPFGPYMGTIIGKYKIADQDGLFGILGPMRQDYQKNIPVAEYVLTKINNFDKK